LATPPFTLFMVTIFTMDIPQHLGVLGFTYLLRIQIYINLSM
jgi:hypothetical protein